MYGVAPRIGDPRGLKSVMLIDGASPEQHVEVGPQHAATHVRGDVQHVMLIVPVDADVNEAEQVALEHRQDGREAFEVAVCRTFSSSIMIVMMMAITPSLGFESRGARATRAGLSICLADAHARHNRPPSLQIMIMR